MHRLYIHLSLCVYWTSKRTTASLNKVRGQTESGEHHIFQYNDISTVGRVRMHTLLLDFTLPVVSICSHDLPPLYPIALPHLPLLFISSWSGHSLNKEFNCSPSVPQMNGASLGLKPGPLGPNFRPGQALLSAGTQQKVTDLLERRTCAQKC